MSRRDTCVVAAVISCLCLSGCGQTSTEEEDGGPKPASVVKAAGQPTKVTLTERAVERLGLQTAAVRRAEASRSGSAQATVIPFTALLFDKFGKAATYVVVGPRTYTRTPVVVDRYDADLAVLASGPPVGASVVTAGSAELSGAEAGLS
jgi:predicted component of type VI protein secretion system